MVERNFVTLAFKILQFDVIEEADKSTVYSSVPVEIIPSRRRNDKTNGRQEYRNILFQLNYMKANSADILQAEWLRSPIWRQQIHSRDSSSARRISRWETRTEVGEKGERKPPLLQARVQTQIQRGHEWVSRAKLCSSKKHSHGDASESLVRSARTWELNNMSS